MGLHHLETLQHTNNRIPKQILPNEQHAHNLCIAQYLFTLATAKSMKPCATFEIPAQDGADNLTCDSIACWTGMHQHGVFLKGLGQVLALLTGNLQTAYALSELVC